MERSQTFQTWLTVSPPSLQLLTQSTIHFLGTTSDDVLEIFARSYFRKMKTGKSSQYVFLCIGSGELGVKVQISRFYGLKIS